MTNDPQLLVKLKNLLRWKKSKKFYAEKLNITEEEVIDLIKEIRDEGEGNDDGNQRNACRWVHRFSEQKKSYECSSHRNKKI